MKKTLIGLMIVLLSAMLFVSCDDSSNDSGNGDNGGTDALPTVSEVGQEVKIGKVTWKALKVDADNSRALLISKDILEKRLFDDASNVYANSDIKNYLNTTTGDGNFFDTYGLSTSYMKRVTISGEGTTVDDTSGTDYLFLLSKTEAGGGDERTTAYFTIGDNGDSERIAQIDGQNTDWWLRTPYESDGITLYIVDYEGDVVLGGKFDISKKTAIGVRPAFWYAWAETEYKITYTIGNGATLAEGNPASYIRYKDTTKNKEIAISKAPTKSGCTFKGWKMKGADDTTANASYTISTDTTGDIELEAVWEEKQILSFGDAITSTDDSISIGKKGKTEIIWKVLELKAQDNRALLISQDVLETRAYDDSAITVYMDSDIQTYLNDTSDSGFFKTYNLPDDYFSYMDMVSYTTVDDGETHSRDNTGGTDFVFLLSETEAGTGDNGYFTTNSSRKAKLLDGSDTAWWLRSRGNSNNYFKYVTSSDGSITESNYTTTTIGLRPAFWYKWNMTT